VAEGFVNVTEGSGKKLHTVSKTIGADTVHDEVVLDGEPYLASYLVTGEMVATTANSHLLQIMAGASLNVRIRRIEMHQTVMATTAALMEVRLYRLTTAGTGGLSITPARLDVADAPSGASAMSLPTAKGTEGTLLSLIKPYMMQTIGASAQLNQPILVWDFDRPRSKPLVIAAGTPNGIAIKNATAIAGASVAITVWIDESSF